MALLCVAAVLLPAAWSAPAPAAGDDAVNFMPFLKVRETYDSNVHLMGRGDMEHRITPGLRMDFKNDRMSGFLQAAETIYQYNRLSEYDSSNEDYQANLTDNATERLTFNFGAEYVVDHTFSSVLNESGEITQEVLRRSATFSPSVTYAVTERNSATLFGTYNSIGYASDIYTDSESSTLGGTWGYQATERTQALMQLAGTHMDMGGARQDVLSPMAGLDYRFNETLKLRALAGMSSMDARTAAGRKSTSDGFAADGSLQWTGERSGASATFRRSIGMDINGQNVTRTQVGLSATRKLARWLSVQLSGYRAETKTVGDLAAAETTRWTDLGPTLSYLPTENIVFSLGYRYGRQETVETHVSKMRNLYYLDFSIALP